MFLGKICYWVYSFFFCLRYLPFKQAIKLPILVYPFIEIGELHKGDIVINGNLSHSMILFGFPGTEGRDTRKFYISIHNGAKLQLGRNVNISKGTRIVIDKGEVSIGNNFYCNVNCFLKCDNMITIGNDNLYGWNVDFNTTDGHSVMADGKWKTKDGPIEIGNHVWICSNCNVGKDVTIVDGCIVSQSSLVIKKYMVENTLIGGVPAKELKYNIEWKA